MDQHEMNATLERIKAVLTPLDYIVRDFSVDENGHLKFTYDYNGTKEEMTREKAMVLKTTARNALNAEFGKGIMYKNQTKVILDRIKAILNRFDFALKDYKQAGDYFNIAYDYTGDWDLTVEEIKVLEQGVDDALKEEFGNAITLCHEPPILGIKVESDQIF